MKELTDIREHVLERLARISDLQQLTDLQIQVLGKKGRLTQLLRALGSIRPEERAQAGKQINALRADVEDLIKQKHAGISEKIKAAKLVSETIDVTLPGKKPRYGRLHPLTQVYEQIRDIFLGLGFQVAEGPEVEYDRNNFELLNMPKNHPARDMQDTFYVSDNVVLRTHTSPMQVREMLKGELPIRIICPGRVYRADEVDATHSPIFHQVEGLVVDSGIDMRHLKGVLDLFAKALYGDQTKTRFRSSYFPFTEPSAEMDISCGVCAGSGCKVCKGTGWIEILGCGMVNPRVLELCGIDPDVYSGFAFGVGLDRTTTMKYGISDIRLLFENDMRFLQQF